MLNNDVAIVLKALNLLDSDKDSRLSLLMGKTDELIVKAESEAEQWRSMIKEDLV